MSEATWHSRKKARVLGRLRVHAARRRYRHARNDLMLANEQGTGKGKALAACRDTRRALERLTHREHVAMLRRERDYWRTQR